MGHGFVKLYVLVMGSEWSEPAGTPEMTQSNFSILQTRTLRHKEVPRLDHGYRISDQGCDTLFLDLKVSCSFLTSMLPGSYWGRSLIYIPVPLECEFMLWNYIYTYLAAHFIWTLSNGRKKERPHNTALSEAHTLESSGSLQKEYLSDSRSMRW